MTEQELHKLFKSKLDGREFEYSPDNWKAMESMLDGKKFRAGGFYWTSVGAIVAFGVLVGSLTFLNPVPQNKDLRSGEQNTPAHNAAEETPIKIEAEANIAQEATANDPASTAGTTSSEKIPAENAAAENNIVGSDAQTASAKNNSPAAMAPRREFGSSNNRMQLFSASWKDLPHLTFTAPDLSEKEINLDIRPQTMPRTLRHGFFVNAGALISGSNKGAVGLGWTAGILYQYRLSNRWALSLGANYRVQNNTGVSDRKDSVYYEFGRQYLEVEKTVQRLEYLEVPLTLGWQITPEQQITAGVYAAQLINVKEEIRYIKHSKAPVTTDREEISGIDPDLQKYDYGFSLGYQYRIAPSLSLAVELRQGIVDVTHNVSEDFSAVHQNLNAGITLQYKLY